MNVSLNQISYEWVVESRATDFAPGRGGSRSVTPRDLELIDKLSFNVA